VQIELCLSFVHEERVNLQTLGLFAAKVYLIKMFGELVEVFVVYMREVRLAEIALFMVMFQVQSEGIKIEVVLVAELAKWVIDQQVFALIRFSFFEMQSELVLRECGLFLEQERSVQDANFAELIEPTRGIDHVRI
jgi:hypothetical protein